MARSVKAPKPKPAAVSRLNPANLITMLRILLVPIFASLMLYHQTGWALAAYATAAITDLVDGWLARRYGWITALGAFIDPMADKLLQLTAVTLLAFQGLAPLWVAVLLWTREAVVVIGFIILSLLGVSKGVHSSWWGKAGTLAQMFSLAGALAVPALGLNGPLLPVLAGFLAGATVVHFLSGLEYAWRGFQAYEQAQAKVGGG